MRRESYVPIADGVRGIRQTGALIAKRAARLADGNAFGWGGFAPLPYDELAEQLIAGVPPHDFRGEAIRLYEIASGRRSYRLPVGIVGTIRYRRERDERLRDPDVFLHTGAGDCDDQTLFLATMLAALGHDPLVRIIEADGANGPDYHVYVVDRTPDGHTLALDATFAEHGAGWEFPDPIRGWDFPVPNRGGFPGGRMLGGATTLTDPRGIMRGPTSYPVPRGSVFALNGLGQLADPGPPPGAKWRDPNVLGGKSDFNRRKAQLALGIAQQKWDRFLQSRGTAVWGAEDWTRYGQPTGTYVRMYFSDYRKNVARYLDWLQRKQRYDAQQQATTQPVTPSVTTQDEGGVPTMATTQPVYVAAPDFPLGERLPEPPPTPTPTAEGPLAAALPGNLGMWLIGGAGVLLVWRMVRGRRRRAA